ncbi:DUF550 domain-containing protein [Serratia rubidaea]|uniref:DUF550 domain-containing protein n=1 Tax=Serratia rubidaea TaxID=61652 RepID=UPI00242A9BFD|nr:DUF550 domain-containing protein [Serratia rubidaea]MCR0998673.1 DUF550 domain-containing protein [Serratia rubidaea]
MWDLLAAREAVPVAGESGASLQLRGLIRQRHAKWSEETFGHVGPVGPLKHLSKEALEAAAEPDDLSEWADIQFLMWDAQRRAGISDAEITAEMEEKLKVNMARQWPEPKDGEPRLHITAPPAPAVPREIPLTSPVAAEYVAGWNACRAAMLEHVSQGYKLVPVAPTPDMIAAAMDCDDVLFNDDDTFCIQFGNIYSAMLAAAPEVGE